MASHSVFPCSPGAAFSAAGPRVLPGILAKTYALATTSPYSELSKPKPYTWPGV